MPPVAETGLLPRPPGSGRPGAEDGRPNYHHSGVAARFPRPLASGNAWSVSSSASSGLRTTRKRKRGACCEISKPDGKLLIETGPSWGQGSGVDQAGEMASGAILCDRIGRLVPPDAASLNKERKR